MAISGARNSNGSITVATDKGWTVSLGVDFETPPEIVTSIMKVYSPSAFTDVQIIQDVFLIVCPERRAVAPVPSFFIGDPMQDRKLGQHAQGHPPHAFRLGTILVRIADEVCRLLTRESVLGISRTILPAEDFEALLTVMRTV